MITDTLPQSKKPQERLVSSNDMESSDEVNNLLAEQRLHEISQDPAIQDLPDEEKREVISDTFELYLKAREFIAPVITGFTDTLLDEAQNDTQVIFAARDGLGSFEAAKALIDKFPENYKTSKDQLAYLYFTRSVVARSGHDLLRRYIEQAGLDTNEPTLIADVGMYGSIMYDLVDIMPNAEARYIISRNPRIPGYADDSGKEERMDCFRSISGNPAVHFVEDTFSGSTSSPRRLIEVNGQIIPDLKEGTDAYEPAELMKRKYAAEAFGDYVAALDTPPSTEDQRASIKKLDNFLLDQAQYRHLMVPHIS